jgi:hypothetical protein
LTAHYFLAIVFIGLEGLLQLILKTTLRRRYCHFPYFIRSDSEELNNLPKITQTICSADWIWTQQCGSNAYTYLPKYCTAYECMCVYVFVYYHAKYVPLLFWLRKLAIVYILPGILYALSHCKFTYICNIILILLW